MKLTLAPAILFSLAALTACDKREVSVSVEDGSSTCTQKDGIQTCTEKSGSITVCKTAPDTTGNSVKTCTSTTVTETKK